MPSTKLFFIPLGEFAAPALLIVHGFEHQGGSAAECHLLEPSGERDPIVDIVYTPKAQAEEQLLDVALIKSENYIRLIRSRVLKEQLSDRGLEDASFAQLSARLLAGQFPHWRTLPNRSRDAQGLALFLDPITPKLSLEPLEGNSDPLTLATEDQPKRRWGPILRLRTSLKSPARSG